MGSRWRRVARASVVFVVVGVAADTHVGAAPCWPPPVEAPVVDPYRAPECRWCPGNRGVEYSTVPGTPVRAVAAGEVTFAGEVAGRRYVVVRHTGGWRVTYGDLDEIAVERGGIVVARSIIGLAGSRFHLGLRDGGGYRDPMPYLGRWSHIARLVPVDGSPGSLPGSARLRCGAPHRPGDDAGTSGIEAPAR